MLSAAVAIATIGAGAFIASPAVAAPVYEITADWVPGTPTTVATGDVVTGEWRVNVNDDAAAPSNSPVDNITITATLQNGLFSRLPDACLTTGVDPVSALSADRATLTCNLGTHDQGTAVVLQTPIEANGPTGSQLSSTGSIAGQSAALSPIAIVNGFGMDIRWGTGAAYISSGANYFETSYEWTLSKQAGSDPGPQTITYDLTIASPQGGTIQIAPQGCTPFDMGIAANGHPWSGGDHPSTHMTSFVDTCTFTQTGPNTFQLTLSGIDYDPANIPTRDSAGSLLPTDQVALASGSIYVRVFNVPGGSATVTSSAPTYTSTSGQTAQDDPSNNSETKTWQPLGIYSSGWGRGYTGSGGTTWDDTYRVAAGTVVGQYLDTGWQRWSHRADNLLVGMCAPFDTRYVTLENFVWGAPAGGVDGAPFEYYTGTSANLDPASPGYNPSAFDCAPATGWSTTPPANLADVKAVRVVMTQGQAEAHVNDSSITPVAFLRIRPSTPAGTEVWSFFSGIHDAPVPNTWTGPDYAGCITNTPGWRYPCTTGFRDVLRISDASPAIVKSADRTAVTPGVPATFTLTYAANGAGQIPPTVDGYQVSDTLPLGLTYVPGSATPAPVVSADGQGRQVLNWTFNGVATNTQHAQTYQAVADQSVTPGTVLTNTAVASYAGQTRSAAAQVTVSTSGYTSIGKTADSPFIPNLAGDGVGEGSWTVTLRSFDPLPQDYTDTIDILPYVGDGRGTDFVGDYELTGVDAVGGATVYYTTANPATLSDDPGDASNGAAGDPSGNTVGWSTTFTPDATAVRVVGPALAAGATQPFTVNIATDGVDGGDVLVNRAQARTEHTELVMRTSASITVANHYSAALKKYVQDAEGVWRDANTVEDYPVYRVGDEIPYRIVIENTGQGTLTGLEITDDLFPEGSFTVAELTPGAQQVHEFTITATGGGNVVNTACGAAAIPDDSGVAPTINCDPAGLELVNYTTGKTADPASGSTVHPGDVITYTIAVTQEGTAAAVAQFTDALAGVTDDTVYNGDLAATIGTATLVDGVISWSGTVPVDGVALVTYSVTVKPSAAIGDEGDWFVENGVQSPGCPDAGCPPVEHTVGAFDVVKSSDPVDGANVDEGDEIEYTVTVTHRGEAAYEGAALVDDLSDLLDDSTWNGELTATGGTVGFDPVNQVLQWSGDLAVGDVVTITYTVTVTGAGDTRLYNVVTSEGCATQEDCETEHYTASYTTVKTADPASGSDVQAGDVITYTVTVTQSGLGQVVGQFFNDDLADALDDATFNDDIVASQGTFTYEDGVIAWTGELGPGDVATVTYSVTVTAAGDTLIGNTVQSPGCESVDDCETTHQTGRYETVKSSDPAAGSTVQIGEVIEYTVTVTQIGEGPVEDASFSDDLSAVVDDATWNDDLAASAGTSSYSAPTLTWSGDLAAGDVVTVTYSVTVTGAGDMTLTNVVTSEGCVDAPSCTTTHETGTYTVSKMSDPASGSDVPVDGVITYTVTVAHQGPGAVTGATITDDLGDVLDDATWNDDAAASTGLVDVEGETLDWTGDLSVGQVVTITYSVTVTAAGDMFLNNEVDPGAGTCVPAPDETPDCATSHQTGRFEYSKMADPVHDSDVSRGDVITYTITGAQVGPAAVPATLIDDLSDVLDDATWNDDAAASTGTVALDATTLTWSGTVGVDEVVTITYSVTVTGAGNTTLANVVTGTGECVPAPDETAECRTVHKTGGYVFGKVANPKSGSNVQVGDVVTYTVTITQRGDGAVSGASVTDDLTAVLDDATWNGNATATSGSVTRTGNTLGWTGDLAVGQVVTLTYSVTVTAAGDDQLRNVVTSSDERALCDPNGVCATDHQVPPPLASTGWDLPWLTLPVALLLLVLGGGALLITRRLDARRDAS
ncbi:DUF7927 domain-containing protein [Agromyces ramosus]|uniref:DUF7927 domain-containing protein n=1 Tax=Agromyces ramosus TaxID=33879 RepID=UPI0027D9248D|nr:hypothetical protein [Agromyces ramosus]